MRSDPVFRREVRAGLALLLAAGVSCDRPPTGPADPAPALESRGITVGDWSPAGVSSPAGLEALDRIAEAGANTAVFVLTIYQADAGSSGFRPGTTPSLAALREAAGHARGLGLEVVLKLHVDVLDGTWRGHVRPADPDAWFAEYGAFVAAAAETAREAEAVALVVGTELAGTTHREARWRALLGSARQRYPGQLLYAASWDEVQSVPFWDALDAVGLDFYCPVADRPDPSRLDILAGWQPWLDGLESISRRTGLPIVLTEIGYMSRDGAGMDPPEWQGRNVPDPGEQADLYWAALQAVSGEEWIRGLWWWCWEIDRAGGPGDVGYTPRGKPALDELQAAWGER